MDSLARSFSKHLTAEQQQLVSPAYLAKLRGIREAAMANQKVLEMIVQGQGGLYGVSGDVIQCDSAITSDSAIKSSNAIQSSSDAVVRIQDTTGPLESLSSTLRQIVRDWAEEGAEEREACYTPILNLLTEHFSGITDNCRVLVPGAGLGRLAFEIARRGFQCQGNEFSHYMLLTSQFILNQTGQDRFIIHPYILPLSNHLSAKDQLRPIVFPDISPISSSSGDFSMIAGDFVEVYGGDPSYDLVGSFDAIVTCFFLDTAKNVIEYIQIFHRLLRGGGVWINLGPLLYHFEGSPVSIELTLEEIVLVAERIGFSKEYSQSISTGYVQNLQSMHKTLYECSLMKFVKNT